MKPQFLAPIVDDAADWCLVSARTGDRVADRIETAFDSASRRRGLLGRSAIPAGFALVIAPCNAVHTFGMRTAIDIVFVDRNGHVIKVLGTVRPWRVCGAWRAFAAIELAYGSVETAGVRKGDRLQLRRAESVPTHC